MKPKVRTDYHELFSSSDSPIHEERVHRWFRSVLFVAFGFILGVIYSKTFVSTGCETLALSTVDNTTAMQSVEVNLSPIAKNQRSKA